MRNNMYKQGLVLAIICLFIGANVVPNITKTVSASDGDSDLPPIIRVLRASIGTVESVDFKLYTKRVLPQEWIGSWPSESLKAGAMAVKTYAWYWINQGGKPVHSPDADVCDTTCCQVYDEDTYYKTNNAVEDTWLLGMRRNGEIFQSEYWDGRGVVDVGAGNHLNIRDNPGIGSNVIAQAGNGDNLCILSNGLTYQDGYHWFFIIHTSCDNLNYDYSGYTTGWVAGEYVGSYWTGENIVNFANRMTQWGSKYWSDQGKDYQWILSYFYPNIEFFDVTVGGEDTIFPTVDAFSVSPLSVTLGGTFTISYTASDEGGSGLKQVELWRKSTGDWEQIEVTSLAGIGDGPYSGSFYDTPSSVGTYWYGIHVVDNAGNWAPEDSPISVEVTFPSYEYPTHTSTGENDFIYGGENDPFDQDVVPINTVTFDPAVLDGHGGVYEIQAQGDASEKIFLRAFYEPGYTHPVDALMDDCSYVVLKPVEQFDAIVTETTYFLVTLDDREPTVGYPLPDTTKVVLPYKSSDDFNPGMEEAGLLDVIYTDNMGTAQLTDGSVTVEMEFEFEVADPYIGQTIQFMDHKVKFLNFEDCNPEDDKLDIELFYVGNMYDEVSAPRLHTVWENSGGNNYYFSRDNHKQSDTDACHRWYLRIENADDDYLRIVLGRWLYAGETFYVDGVRYDIPAVYVDDNGGFQYITLQSPVPKGSPIWESPFSDNVRDFSHVSSQYLASLPSDFPIWVLPPFNDNYYNEDGENFDPIDYRYYENQPPDPPTNPNPIPGEENVELNPILSVDVTDPDGDPMDVTFYDVSDGSVIGTDYGVPSGGTTTTTWSGLYHGATYFWYTIADDGSDSTQSSTWSFTTKINQLPVADAGIDQTVSSGELVWFDGSNSYDLDGEIDSYEWDFGDGATATGPTVSHRFRGAMNEPKTYIVTLTVDDGRGGTDTDTVNVVVEPLEKQAVLGLAGMRVTYNWVKQNNGKDTYIVTKIKAWTIAGWAGVAQFSILSGDTTLWRDVWLFPHFHDKDYYSPFIPTNDWIDLQFGAQFGVIPTITIMIFPGESFEGIKVYADDKIEVKTRGLVAGIGIVPSPNVDTAWTTFDPNTPVESSTIFTPLENTWNWLTGKLFSPCEFRIYDSEGRVTGLMDGEVIEEIPYSVYEQNILMVLFPPEWLLYEILGKDEGFYGLSIASPFDEEIIIFNASNIPTSTGIIHQYIIDWNALSQGEEGVTLQIDNDGDGTFERTITSDDELTQDEFILQTETVIDIDPDTLNLKSKGKWITCYIELPEGYNVEDININTIMLNDIVPAEVHPTNIGDNDNDGIPDLMVKFDRQEVINILETGENVEITVAGELQDGTRFEGIDYIRVI